MEYQKLSDGAQYCSTVDSYFIELQLFMYHAECHENLNSEGGERGNNYYCCSQ